jgi:hypothetical protein
MDTDILVRGKVLAIKESRDPDTKKVTGHSLQLVKRNGRNALDLLNVKLFEGADPLKYQEGTSVELAVDISTYKDNVYYRATRDVQAGKADTRAAPKPATAS